MARWQEWEESVMVEACIQLLGIPVVPVEIYYINSMWWGSCYGSLVILFRVRVLGGGKQQPNRTCIWKEIVFPGIAILLRCGLNTFSFPRLRWPSTGVRQRTNLRLRQGWGRGGAAARRRGFVAWKWGGEKCSSSLCVCRRRNGNCDRRKCLEYKHFNSSQSRQSLVSWMPGECGSEWQPSFCYYIVMRGHYGTEFG